jgi:hypothetical protein
MNCNTVIIAKGDPGIAEIRFPEYFGISAKAVTFTGNHAEKTVQFSVTILIVICNQGIVAGL